ncbi:MAG TPA: chromate transporter [Armatimonadota bacterium]|nr:chromate transporter [Armatimonadota bacterium]
MKAVDDEGATAASYSLRDLVRYFLVLGTVGFGGPVALVGYMHRDLVERRSWISEEDYNEGLALAQLAPGPLAAQLGIYLGYVHYGVVGATLAGLAFVLPSFLMVLAISWAYVRFGGLSWMQSVFYGVGAAVIGIIALSAYRLTTRTLKRERLLWSIYLAALLATVITESENVLLFLGAGVLAWLVKAPPRPRASSRISSFAAPAMSTVAASLVNWTADWGLLGRMALFFGKAGAFVFGSGLAIVPFLYAGCVHEMKWLDNRQFLDAVAVAMITPGPVVITTAFIGYMVAGWAGAGVAALATFLPCYLFTILPAPHFKRWGREPAVLAFVQGVTAAATGAIAGAVIILARRSLVDGPTLLLAGATLVVLWQWKKIPEPVVVLVAAALGLVIRTLTSTH